MRAVTSSWFLFQAKTPAVNLFRPHSMSMSMSMHMHVVVCVSLLSLYFFSWGGGVYGQPADDARGRIRAVCSSVRAAVDNTLRPRTNGRVGVHAARGMGSPGESFLNYRAMLSGLSFWSDVVRAVPIVPRTAASRRRLRVGACSPLALLRHSVCFLLGYPLPVPTGASQRPG